MIDVSDLAVSRGGRPVLEGLSLSVEEGAFVGLVGPNGAGKTTLLHAINGVLEPAAGAVAVDGRPVADCSARVLGRLVATVPQQPSVGFDFSVREIVAMGRTPYHGRLGGGDYREDRRHVERALERTATAALADRSIDAVSGGERQRVMLARALAQDAPVLLLDEPTASLDVNHQVRTLQLVSDLVAGGKTAVAAIHDLDLAARFCDRLCLLADGDLLATGPPESVLESEYLDPAFDATTAVTTDPATGSPSVAALTDRPDRDLAVQLVGSGRLGARVLAALDDAGVAVTAGVLPEGDVTAAAADAREIEAVTAPAFGAVDHATHERAVDLLGAESVLVVANPPAGVRDALPRYASAAAGTVLVDEADAGERSLPADLPSGAPAVSCSPGDVVGSVLSVVADRGLAAEDGEPDARSR
ncbi:MAG: ATP-binding cassette domain-containing protein [Haloarculaceae archaeon]